MKKLFLITLILLTVSLGVQVFAAEQLTFTSHYPSPFGTYSELRLVPRDTSAITCDSSSEGLLAFDSILGEVQGCSNNVWGPLGGQWALTGNNLYPIATTSNPNLRVGIGTSTPSTKMEINKTVAAGGFTELRLTNEQWQGSIQLSFEERNLTDSARITYNSDPGNTFNVLEFWGVPWGEYMNRPIMTIEREPGTNSGLVTIGPPSAAYITPAMLEVRNWGNEDILNLFDDTNEVMTVIDGGNVGIGTTWPQALLHVESNTGITAVRIQETTGLNSVWELRAHGNTTPGSAENNFSIWGGNAGWEDYRMVFTSTGNVGIKRNDPQYTLEVGGGGDVAQISTDGSAHFMFWDTDPGERDFMFDNFNNHFRFGNNNTGLPSDWGWYAKMKRNTLNNRFGFFIPWTRDGGGDFEVNNTAHKADDDTLWDIASDIRLKKNVQPLVGALDKILQLRGVEYKWIDPERFANRTDYQKGFIAQEVEQVFPDWVNDGPDGYKILTIKGVNALFVESMKELHSKVNDMKKENEHLRNRIERLKKLLEE